MLSLRMSSPERDGVLGDLDQAAEVVAYVGASLESVRRAAEAVVGVLRDGGVVLACGNGGSALQAQHFSAELVGRFREERRSLPALALSADPGAVTGIANDYGFEEVFARQVAGFGPPAALVAFSTSGNSPNVVRAVETARASGIRTIALTGAGGGAVAPLADHAFRVPSRNTARIQEGHLLLLHLICEEIDAAFRG